MKSKKFKLKFVKVEVNMSRSRRAIRGYSDAGVIMARSTRSCFEWDINPYSNCSNMLSGSFIESPEFFTSFLYLSNWILKLYPSGETKESKDYIDLYLINNSDDDPIEAEVKFFLLDNKNNKMGISYVDKQIYYPGSGWGTTKFVLKQFITCNANKLLVGDTLKILCEICCSDPTYALYKTTEATNTDEVEELACRTEEFDDFEKLLENGHFQDVTIEVGEQKFQAHKAIIASRSPVFKAMFIHDTKEKQENKIEIIDIKPEIVKEMLRFMYAGKVNNIEEITNDLLMAAEKYSIFGLKNLCVKTMYRILKIENAFEFLNLAYICNITDLKKYVIDFIVANQQAVSEKPEFGLFTGLHSELQLELVRALIAKNSTQRK